MDITHFKVGEEIFYAGTFYKIVEIKDFPHGIMLGIYDEPPSNHIDYLNPRSVQKVFNCYNCQGGGCPACACSGFILI